MEDLNHVNITMVRTTEDVLNFLRWLGERRNVLAVDTETGGLVWYRDRLRLVQIGDRDSAWCFDAEDWMGLLRDVLERYDGEFVFHNAKFDVHYLEHRGRVKWTADMWKRTHDTAIMAHLHQPDVSRQLKSLTTTYINPKAALAQKVLDTAMTEQRWGWDDIPIDYPYYWAYGGLDTVLTARLFDALPRDRFTPELYEVERRVLWSVYKMEVKGAHVDVDFAYRKRGELQAYIEQVKNWAKATYGLESITSNVQIIKKMQELGVELTKLTNSGANYAMDAEVLEAIDHPLAAGVLKARQAHKIAGTYLSAFIDDSIDGIFRVDLNTLGTRTGRMTGGILQTLTRGKGPVRDSFISRHDDGRMIMVDFDQIEMRQLAELSGDPALITAFGSGDFFTTMTRAIYKDDSISKSDLRRQRTKNARYARNYGAGLPKIALTNGISLEEVEFIEAGWTTQFPVAAQFPRRIELLARERMREEGKAYVTTPTLKRYEPAKGNELYQLVNYLTQGFAADVFKEAIVRCDEAGLDEFLILPVHDEAVFDVPPELVEEVTRTAPVVMQDNRYALPFTTGVDVVERWGDKYL